MALARLRRWLLGVSARQVSFEKRGFRATAPVRAHLERVAATFLEGYHIALEEDSVVFLCERLDSLERELRGWGHEGAAMGLALRDHFTLRSRRRLDAFIKRAPQHIYMIHVGAGWALARLRRPVGRSLERFDPLLRWLVVDGYGFHEGYFRARRWSSGERPAHLADYALRAFDQGLGRSLWFSCGADPERIAGAVASLAEDRAADLWSGVGLAGAYAGGAPQAIDVLRAMSGSHLPAFAQGVAFAAKARERAGNATTATEHACQSVWGMSAEQASAVTDACLSDMPGTGDAPAYEVWRARIREHFLSGSRVS